MQKSFKARLAALEAIENVASADNERQAYQQMINALHARGFNATLSHGCAACKWTMPAMGRYGTYAELCAEPDGVCFVCGAHHRAGYTLTARTCPRCALDYTAEQIGDSPPCPRCAWCAPRQPTAHDGERAQDVGDQIIARGIARQLGPTVAAIWLGVDELALLDAMPALDRWHSVDMPRELLRATRAALASGDLELSVTRYGDGRPARAEIAPRTMSGPTPQGRDLPDSYFTSHDDGTWVTALLDSHRRATNGPVCEHQAAALALLDHLIERNQKEMVCTD